MQASESLIAAIKQFEGFRAHAYRDAGGVLTIGYGHTGSDVRLGDTITEELAELDLRAELTEKCLHVSKLIHPNLEQWQWDALVDFAYNLGAGALQSSTLRYCINRGDMVGAAAQFTRWCHDGSVILPGLYIRRKSESLWFRNAMPVSYPTAAQYSAWLAEAETAIKTGMVMA